MKLITLKRFRQTTEHFEPGSMPSNSTLKRWVENGEIDGKRIGGIYYIDLDGFASDDDALVDAVLAGHS